MIGLERALRVHYKPKDECYGSPCRGSQALFPELFQKAIEDGRFNDALFSEIRVWPDFDSENWFKPGESHVETLARQIPKMRNDYFHGTFIMFPELFLFAIQLRELADALKTKGAKNLPE